MEAVAVNLSNQKAPHRLGNLSGRWCKMHEEWSQNALELLAGAAVGVCHCITRLPRNDQWRKCIAHFLVYL